MTKADMVFWLGYLFLGLSITMMLYVKYLQSKVEQSLYWPSAQGEIVRSELVERTAGGGVSGYSTTYMAKIEYQYQVRGKPYLGDRVTIGVDVGTGSRKRGEDRSDRYQVNSPVTVYYNPDNPEDACLERRVDAPYFLYTIAGAFGFFGLIMATGVWHWMDWQIKKLGQ